MKYHEQANLRNRVRARKWTWKQWILRYIIRDCEAIMQESQSTSDVVWVRFGKPRALNTVENVMNKVDR